MSQDASARSVRPSNPLILPLLVVSVVAVAEGFGLILLIVLLALRAPSAPASGASVASPPPPPGGQRTVASGQEAADAQGFAVGKMGQRVDSAGLGITVEQINREPQYKNLTEWGSDYRYLALLIVVDNNTGGNIQLLPATFRLVDGQGYPYQQLGMKLTEPKLDLAVLGNREKVKGYLDFVVPKSAKGLKLVYWGVPARNSQPIHVELGE